MLDAAVVLYAGGSKALEMVSCVRRAVSSDMHGGTASFVAMLDAAGRTAAGEMSLLAGAALTDRVWTAICLASLVR